MVRSPAWSDDTNTGPEKLTVICVSAAPTDAPFAGLVERTLSEVVAGVAASNRQYVGALSWQGSSMVKGRPARNRCRRRLQE